MSENQKNPCRECGQNFTRSDNWPSNFSQTICGPCLEIIQAKNQATKQRLEDSAKLKRRNDVVPPLYREFDSSLLPTDRGRELSEYLNGYEFGPIGIGLSGEARLGKTFLIYDLIGRLVKDSKTGAIAINGAEFAANLANFGERDMFISQCKSRKILFVDDLAKAKMTERVEADLWMILEHRKNHFLPVFATLNCNSKHLAEMFSPEMSTSIVERLREICKFSRIF